MSEQDTGVREINSRQELFTRHIQRLGKFASYLSGIDRRYTWIRLGILVLGVAGVFLAFLPGLGSLGVGCLFVAIAAFIVVVYFHRKVDFSRERAAVALRLAKAQIARLELNWKDLPLPPLPRVEPGHPFGFDLDLSGPRSLHHLIDTAVSVGGSQRLLDWLLNPQPDPDQIRYRQALLKELSTRPAFRSRLVLNGALAQGSPGKQWNSQAIFAWLSSHAESRRVKNFLLALSALALIDMLLFAAQLIWGIPPLWMGTIFIYLVSFYAAHQRYGEVFVEAYDLAGGLAPLQAVFSFLGRYSYSKDSALAALCRPFWNVSRQPSSYLQRLERIAGGASLSHNPVLGLINIIVPWDIYFAYLLDQVKHELQDKLPGWLETWYDLEALDSLGNFAYLNPGYVFPTILSQPEAGPDAVFSAKEMGHPLIPPRVRISNDFTVRKLGEVVLISGSNMSGKSSFLRTLGVNLSLAYAGGPVAAKALSTLPFRLFTCINVSDYLSDGISYFYAEVRRLKALLKELEQANSYPLFFLIDEIFRGTNNRERQSGSRAYVRALVGKHGVGVISTHDLELVRLADEISGVANVHFRDAIQDGRMVFDYKLRPGPSPTTNALKIMAMEGLPVED